jgi:ADP-ribosylglycohydrolase
VRRAAGSLFGLAYGDALGKPTEFLRMPEIIQRYGPGGPRDLEGDPALVTDDTQMALEVAGALRETPEWTVDAFEPLLRTRFVAWSISPENNRAPGRTCMRACRHLARGVPWVKASVLESKGCGANMRVTPVGLVPGIDEDTMAGLAQFQAALTHGHATGLAAAELTAYAVRVLARGEATLADLPAALRERGESQRHVYRADWLGDVWQRPAETTPEEYIGRGWHETLVALDRLDAALAHPDRDADPCLATGGGWVAEEALATALHCALLYPDDPVSALARAAATSGDSDSIACLAGAFHGAAHGMDAWPPEWAGRIEHSADLAALGAHWDA